MPKKTPEPACMTPEEAKELISELGLNGVEFSNLMGFYKNRVTDFTRKGVPDNIAIILKLSVALKKKRVDPIKIIKSIKSSKRACVEH